MEYAGQFWLLVPPNELVLLDHRLPRLSLPVVPPNELVLLDHRLPRLSLPVVPPNELVLLDHRVPSLQLPVVPPNELVDEVQLAAVAMGAIPVVIPTAMAAIRSANALVFKIPP
jgi:hypothetical protein